MGAGRPSRINKDVLSKLEAAFINGFTDEQACIYASISPVTLYRYCEKHPEFRKTKELLRHSPELKAKLNINNRINKGDVEISKWYLERKCKDEFSTRAEVTGKDGNTQAIIVVQNEADQAALKVDYGHPN